MRYLLLALAIAVQLAGCAHESPAEVEDASDSGITDPGSSGLDAAAPADASAPDAEAPDAGPLDAGSEDAGEALDAGSDAGEEPLPPVALFSIEPPKGGASVETRATLRGEGFGDVLSVEVGGGVSASDLEKVDSHTLRATFPSVALTEVGPRTVRVELVDGSEAELSDGFEYFFDEDPIVFVHGFGFSPFGTMVDRFRAAGYPDSYLRLISFSEPFGSNLKNVLEIEAFVETVRRETGAERVDMIVHSMGGLSSRLYLKNRAGWLYVRDYVALAGANHGTGVANLAPSDGAREMRPAYACWGETLNDVQPELNGCLTDDGRTVDADETPYGIEDGGPISYLSISSEQDEIIIPSESSCLNQSFKNDCSDPVNVRVSWLGHGTILGDQHVFDLAIEHLRKRNVSKP
jgi:triacylglycerol lipase